MIERLVPWEASNNEDILNEARWEIARSVAWGLGQEPPAQGDGPSVLSYLHEKAPPVYDPFSGGGSIPLEAQRLGLRAYGSDLNPVAALIGKALVEIPPKFAGLPPVNPGSHALRGRAGVWQGRGAQGLAEDVRYYGQWMRDEAARRIGHLYPKATLPDGTEATVIAWLWARTVCSPDPSARGAYVPLLSSYYVCNKIKKKSWAQIVLDQKRTDGWRFEVVSGEPDVETHVKLKQGTVGRKGGICSITSTPISLSYIRSEGRAGRLRSRLICIIADSPRGRIYLSPTELDEKVGDIPVPETVGLEQELATNPRDIKAPTYGMTKWADLFSSRQLTALSVLSDLVSEARELALGHARSNGMATGFPLQEGGAGAVAYADAIATYLAFGVSRQTNRCSNLSFWDNTSEKVQQVFGRQAIPMVWDFAEANIFSTSSGNFLDQVEFPSKSVAAWYGTTAAGTIRNLNAIDLDTVEGSTVFSTDPPYYDNIPYSELSDFFYVWLRKAIRPIWPDLFRRLLTPKLEELVASPYRHGSKAAAERHFINGMRSVLAKIQSSSRNAEPVTIYYAFKQVETGEEGVTSAGWSSFLQAVVDFGFIVDGTWPIRTELTGNLKGKMSVLASSVVLVCRKRTKDADIVTRADLVRSLKRELPSAIEAIRKAGVGPVDMQQSVIGPGMGVFSRYDRVLENDDSIMDVRTALALINRVWEEIENELDTAFDAETQVALAWFATYGFDARPSGDLITLANAKNIPLGALFSSGVFRDFHGKAGLIARADLPTVWSPRADRSPTVWECVQHTARILAAADGGAAAAAALLAQMPPAQADGARALAYRLFEIATQKAWASEALVYNELAQEWPRLEELASDATAGSAIDAQGDMFSEAK